MARVRSRTRGCLEGGVDKEPVVVVAPPCFSASTSVTLVRNEEERGRAERPWCWSARGDGRQPGRPKRLEWWPLPHYFPFSFLFLFFVEEEREKEDRRGFWSLKKNMSIIFMN